MNKCKQISLEEYKSKLQDHLSDGYSYAKQFKAIEVQLVIKDLFEKFDLDVEVLE
jgi:hypothetical protein